MLVLTDDQFGRHFFPASKSGRNLCLTFALNTDLNGCFHKFVFIHDLINKIAIVFKFKSSIRDSDYIFFLLNFKKTRNPAFPSRINRTGATQAYIESDPR